MKNKSTEKRMLSVVGVLLLIVLSLIVSANLDAKEDAAKQPSPVAEIKITVDSSTTRDSFNLNETNEDLAKPEPADSTSETTTEDTVLKEAE